ncbi:hypothetical protein [Marinivivus vitaminiproducens]|uniref:hypothetical protein n=1 Tax=Marinivivus vitaminiproducens TaxID=3035935 RepID=UPI0027AB2763|nr:hypothetical protein P4R82_10655 [Geminicoccaceae bacterium SCSIO 64248]
MVLIVILPDQGVPSPSACHQHVLAACRRLPNAGVRELFETEEILFGKKYLQRDNRELFPK